MREKPEFAARGIRYFIQVRNANHYKSNCGGALETCRRVLDNFRFASGSHVRVRQA